MSPTADRTVVTLDGSGETRRSGEVTTKVGETGENAFHLKETERTEETLSTARDICDLMKEG